MSRRRKPVSWTQKLITWAAVSALVGWGAWQSLTVWRAVRADIGPLAEPAPESPRPPAAPAIESPEPLQRIYLADSPDLAGEPADHPATTPRQEESDRPPATTQAVAARAKQIDLLLADAQTAGDAGDLVERRTRLNDALTLLDEGDLAQRVRDELAALNRGVFLGPEILPDDPYALLVSVDPGDTFARLARRYKIPRELLALLNPQIDQRSMKPGTGLKAVFGPFHLRVLKTAGRLDLYARDMYVRSYHADLEDGNLLPLGTYRLKSQGRVALPATSGETPKVWVGFEGLEPATRDVTAAWFYGSAGVRGTAHNGRFSGVRVDDLTLRELYNVLVESDSLVKVDP